MMIQLFKIFYTLKLEFEMHLLKTETHLPNPLTKSENYTVLCSKSNTTPYIRYNYQNYNVWYSFANQNANL